MLELNKKALLLSTTFVFAFLSVIVHSGDIFKSFAADSNSSGSFHISQLINDSDWQEKYSTDFETGYSIKTFAITPLNNSVTIRIEQRDVPNGDIDYAKLTACNNTITPSYAIKIKDTQSVLEDIQTDDNNVVIVHDNPIEIDWTKPSDCDEDFRLEIKANQYESNESDAFRFPFKDQGNKTYYYQHSTTITLDGKLDEVDGKKVSQYSPYWIPTTGHPWSNTFFYLNDDNNYVYISADITGDNTNEFGTDWIELTAYNTTTQKPRQYKVTDLDNTYGKCDFGKTSKVSYKHQTCELKIPKSDVYGNSLEFSIKYYGTLGGFYGFDAGDGSINDPFRMCTCTQLNIIGQNVDIMGGKYFSITDDIDCVATSISDPEDPRYDANLYNNGAGLTTIGYYDFVNFVGHSWWGTIDGNNHTISNLTIKGDCVNTPLHCSAGGTSPSYSGLFGYGSPVIHNLNFTNIDLVGGNGVGLMGYAFISYDDQITNVTISGNVSGLYNVGLLAGGIERPSTSYSTGTNISKVKTSGEAHGVSRVGGIAGNLFGALKISDSYSTVEIYGDDAHNDHLGGFVGNIDNYWNSSDLISPRIYNSYSSGSIGQINPEASTNNTGGFIGMYDNGHVGLLSNNFSTAIVTVNGTSGGFLGTYSGIADTDFLTSSYQTTEDCVSGNDELECKTTLASNLQGNSVNAPLNAWDFISTWYVTEGYPHLQPVILEEPTVPNNVHTTQVGTDQATITWENPTNSGGTRIIYNEIFYKVLGDEEWIEVKSLGSDLSQEISNLSPGTQYEYKVRLTNLIGASDFSDTFEFTTSAGPETPSAPLNFSLSPEENGFNVDFTWETPLTSGSASITNYRIYYKTSSQSWEDEDIQSFWIDAEATNFEGLHLNNEQTEYNFRIAALNNVEGELHYSDEISYQTPELSTHHISTCQELQDINSLIEEDFNVTNDKFVLDNDIDCAETETWNWFEKAEVFEGFEPITFLNAVFDGKGYKISNLYINRETEDGVGLFVQLGDATIKNLTLENASIYGSEDVGALFGYNDDYTVNIDNVNVIDSQISGQYYIGGFLGYSNGTLTISNSTFFGDVNSYEGSGGFAGYSDGNIILETCTASGNVTSQTMRVGGLVGYSSLITVINTQNSADVSGSYRVGGFVGSSNEVTIIDSSNTGEITASYEGEDSYSDFKGVGGLVGIAFNTSILNSFNKGDVTGTGTLYVGGLIGAGGFTNQLRTSYNTGTITGNIVDHDYNGVGGLVGSAIAMDINNCFNEGNVIGKVRVGGLLGYGFYSLVNNSYNVGDISTDGEVISGGLVGDSSTMNEFDGNPPLLSLTNSFNTGQVTSSEESLTGSISGNISGENLLENNWWYNDFAKGVGTREEDLSEGEYEKAESVDIFKGNQINSPLSLWDFTDIWYSAPNKYPIFKYSVDLTPPVITLIGENSLTIDFESTYNDQGATASDNVDGNITSRIVVTNNVNTSIAGTYTVEYNVKDIAENEAETVTRTVIVREKPAVLIPPSNNTNPTATRTITTAVTNQPTTEPTKILLNAFQEYLNGSGKDLLLVPNQVIYFEVKTIEHTATVKTIGEGYVIVTLSSTPQDVRLALRETKESDVDNDGVNDIRITLNSITNGKTDIKFVQLAAPIAPVTKTDTASTTPTVTQEPVSNNENSLSAICLGSIVILGLVVVVVYIKNSKSRK